MLGYGWPHRFQYNDRSFSVSRKYISSWYQSVVIFVQLRLAAVLSSWAAMAHTKLSIASARVHLQQSNIVTSGQSDFGECQRYQQKLKLHARNGFEIIRRQHLSSVTIEVHMRTALLYAAGLRCSGLSRAGI